MPNIQGGQARDAAGGQFEAKKVMMYGKIGLKIVLDQYLEDQIKFGIAQAI